MGVLSTSWSGRPNHSRILYDTLTTDQFSAAEKAARSAGLSYYQMRMDDIQHNFGQACSLLEQEGAQAVVVLSSPLILSFLIFSGLLIITAIDHPFAGTVRVQPGALLAVLEDFSPAVRP
jgi:hypothetical protein